jgi:hypothetical protein
MKNICVIFSKRANKPFMSSVEDRDNLQDGQTEFVSQYSQNPAMFNVQNVSCTPEVFEVISPLANTMEAPALIASPAAPQYVGRLNVYIESGELKTV